MRRKIREADGVLEVRNASGKSVQIVGSVDFVVQIGIITQVVKFLVDEKLETPVLLGAKTQYETRAPRRARVQD